MDEHKMEKLSVDEIVEVIKRNGLCEFENIVRDKKLDGKVLMAATEGNIKRWQIKANGKRFINFINDFKCNPDKFIANRNDKSIDNKAEVGKTVVNIKHNETITVESNGNRVSVTKVSEENFTTSSSNIEEIIYKIAPPKSFLYRNKKTKKLKTPDNKTAYVPMNVVKPTNRQRSRLFRLSSYEYPFFDLSKFKYFTSTNRNERNEAFNDRGYYCMKNQQNNQEDIYRTPAPKIRRKSLSNADDIDGIYFEDHFYEDLCYDNTTKEANVLSRNSARAPYIVRVQELFQSIKMAKFFKHHPKNNAKLNEEEPSCSDMYDSVHVNTALDQHKVEKKQATVEEYLEPINSIVDYCDVVYKEKDDSLVGIILKMFESRKFGNRKEPTDTEKSISEDGSSNFTEIQSPSTSYMADRPLPVPLENEHYFMKIDRVEAFQMLQGHEDGTFILRPSSQLSRTSYTPCGVARDTEVSILNKTGGKAVSALNGTRCVTSLTDPNHAYTLSICCSGTIQNIGVRRREDGKLALGYARKGERSFTNIPSLLRYHKQKKLLLVAGGTNLGSTTLKESPMYYQVPSNIPVRT